MCMKVTLRRPLILASVIVATTLCFVSVLAVDIPVTTPDDHTAPEGACSLRAAVEAANTDAAVDGCPAGAGADRILLPAGVYTLTSSAIITDTNANGDLDLLTEIALLGADARTTVIDGNALDRILHISTTATVTVADLTLTNGHAPDGPSNDGERQPPGDGGHGGAILNEGDLWLQRVIVWASRAGDGGSLEMGPPVLWQVGRAGFGGGVYNRGALTITASAIVSNTAGHSGHLGTVHYDQAGSGGDGGGVYNAGVLLIQNSTIADNLAPDGQDVSNLVYYTIVPGDGGSGGGIANAGSLTLDNLTLAANRAGRGGIGTNGGYYTETGASGVGGGLLVYPAGEAKARNAIMVSNTAAAAPDDCAGALVSLGFNLIEITTGCVISGSVGSNVYAVAPGLGPLGIFTGTTPTLFAPYTGPAVDRGDCIDSTGVVVAFDQAGTPRPQLGGCDIGASEAVLPERYHFLPVIGR